MSQKQKGDDKIHCSFCGRGPEEVSSIIAGPDVYICDHWRFELCGHYPEQHGRFPKKEGKRESRPHTEQLKEALDQYVIGQDPGEENAVGRRVQPLQAHRFKKTIFRRLMTSK